MPYILCHASPVCNILFTISLKRCKAEFSARSTYKPSVSRNPVEIIEAADDP